MTFKVIEGGNNSGEATPPPEAPKEYSYLITHYDSFGGERTVTATGYPLFGTHLFSVARLDDKMNSYYTFICPIEKLGAVVLAPDKNK